MKTTREIHYVKGANISKGVFFEGEVTGDMLRAMESNSECMIFETKFIREESTIVGKLHP